ncbi:MAG: hypothetical protein V4629_03220 [Pseudomonadota bacterium]
MTDFTAKWRAGNTVYLRCGGSFVLPENRTNTNRAWLSFDLNEHQSLFWLLEGNLMMGTETPLDIVKIESKRFAGARQRMREIMWGSDRENEA